MPKVAFLPVFGSIHWIYEKKKMTITNFHQMRCLNLLAILGSFYYFWKGLKGREYHWKNYTDFEKDCNNT